MKEENMSNEVAIRQNPLVESLERADDILRRSYLLQLHTCPIVSSALPERS